MNRIGFLPDNPGGTRPNRLPSGLIRGTDAVQHYAEKGDGWVNVGPISVALQIFGHDVSLVSFYLHSFRHLSPCKALRAKQADP